MRKTSFATLLLSIGCALVSLPARPVLAWFCGVPAPPPEPGNVSPHPQCFRCETCSGSPCFARTGSYEMSATDVRIPTFHGALEVTRRYSSAKVYGGPLGIGWTMGLSARLSYWTTLSAAPSTYVTEASVLFPDGVAHRYRQNADGTFTPLTGRKDTLVRNADGTFDLTLEKSRDHLVFAANGNLLRSIDEFGNALVYTYAGDMLQSIADGGGSGRALTLTWGTTGNLDRVTDSTGRAWLYTYSDGTLIGVTDPLGHTTHYAYTAKRFGMVLTSITDNHGREIARVAYDASGRVESYTEQGETFRYTYDPANTQTTKTDSRGNAWTFRYNADGHITERIQPGGATSKRSLFDADGLIYESIDEAGVRTQYSYDSRGLPSTVTQAIGTASAVEWLYGPHPSFPTKIQSVRPFNPATGMPDLDRQGLWYDYDASGALSATYRFLRDGSSIELLRTYVHDAKGRLTSELDPYDRATDYAYDAAGNVRTVTAPINNNATRPVTTYTYDALGRVLTVTDPAGRQTSYTYDALGRILTATLPAPAGTSSEFTTTYSYDGWDPQTSLVYTTITDPNSRQTRLYYDQFGRLARSEAPSLTGPGENVTIYAHDGGRLASISDPNGNTTSYQYDALARLTLTTFPDGAIESYTYTSDGLLATKRDRRGNTISYQYDPLKRLTRKSYPNGTSITYTYSGQLLTSVVDTLAEPDETHTITYDSSFRPAHVTQGTRGGVSYTYRSDDRITTMAVDNGPTVFMQYYQDGSPRTRAWSYAPSSFTFTYDSSGLPLSIAFPNGQTRDYSYDGQGRVVQVTNRKDSTTLASYAYGYDLDAAGNATMRGQRTSLTTTVPHLGLSNAVTRFGYDALYQLTSAAYPPGAPFNGETHAWTYDNIGNRLSETVNGTQRTYGYTPNSSGKASQRLLTDGVHTYLYDAAGNNTDRGGSTQYTYDFENRLVGISGSASASYAYDFLGRRTSKTVAGITTTYLYDGIDPIREVTGSVPTDFLSGFGVDEHLAVYRSGALSYLSVDGLGSVTQTTNAGGAPAHSTAFDAWGVSRREEGTRSQPFTFTGREVGEAASLFYRARFYEPAIGRFTQEDPIGLGEASLRYAYALNEPLGLRDEDGKAPTTANPSAPTRPLPLPTPPPPLPSPVTPTRPAPMLPPTPNWPRYPGSSQPFYVCMKNCTGASNPWPLKIPAGAATIGAVTGRAWGRWCGTFWGGWTIGTTVGCWLYCTSGASAPAAPW